ncbi:MAG: efflux RND transporter permease subunit [Bacteroidales bacterium]|nr:efflux RND transporter permease subunit [Bacteroidales bacterium]
MNVKTFIDRPILSGVISVAIVIVGVIALLQLPLEQFPDIAPPTVSVMANYPGASASTCQKSVAVPLEEAINGVENMMYMVSNATNAGSTSISIYFKQGTDPDMSVVNVQNRVAEAQRLLPAEVTRTGVTIRKRQTSTLMFVSLYSPDDSFQSNFLTNYMQINIEPRLSRIPGVGEVNVFGARYSMRIWLDPGKMAMYSLVPSDIASVLNEQNIEASTGKLGSETENVFVYTLNYRGRYEREEEYENMVIKSLPDGRILRLKDVARIELGAQQYNFFNEVDGHPSCNCMIVQTSGSNANEVIKQVQAVFKEVEKELPAGMKLATIMSIKDFLDASILEVIKTLLLAILLVVIVVYLFLHDFRATLIPTISILVSLIGTFAFIYAAGFSLNLITLFALVLVIGTVVDDSIVVVEAVQARFDNGYRSAYHASIDAMGGLTSAIVTNTLVFMAVFIPVCFMGGTTGIFYTQFGLTMAVAVGISCINSLTLSPALCALIMRPRADIAKGEKASFSDRFHFAFNRSFARFQARYAFGELGLFKRKWLVWILFLVAVVGLGYMLSTTKTGLVPQEDMGSISVNVQAAPGTNLEQTEHILEEVEEIIRDIPQVRLYSRTAGRDSRGTTTMGAGSFNLRLKHWDERKSKEDGIEAVMEDIYRRTAHISAATIRLSTRPMIAGYGSGSGFEMHVQDRKGGSIEDLLKQTRQFIAALNEREEISRAFTSFDTKHPQYIVDVDAALCIRNGLKPTDVLNALSVYVGGSYVSNFNRFTKLYRVMVQASPEYRTSPEDLHNIYVRNSSGQMSPLSEYVRLTRTYGAESLSRFNLFPSIAVYGENGKGYSSGQVIKAIREEAAKNLPEGYGYEFGGMSREEAQTGNTTAIVFGLCLVFIFLILCALYESLMIPLAVILSVPFGLAGSFLFAKIWGLENNIYLQIGLIMLIGLLAKTAVLLTEYATQAREKGMSITQAAMSAAKDRLRPILMTSLTMIIGLLPLVFANGVGAKGNVSVGVGAVGGMLIGTIALLLVTPVFFIIFEYIQERYLPARHVGLNADSDKNGEDAQ